MPVVRANSPDPEAVCALSCDYVVVLYGQLSTSGSEFHMNIFATENTTGIFFNDLNSGEKNLIDTFNCCH